MASRVDHAVKGVTVILSVPKGNANIGRENHLLVAQFHDARLVGTVRSNVHAIGGIHQVLPELLTGPGPMRSLGHERHVGDELNPVGPKFLPGGNDG